MNSAPKPPRTKAMQVLIHVCACLFLLTMSPMLVGHVTQHMGVQEVMFAIIPPLAMIAVFYATYLVLVPHYLSTHKYKRFIMGELVMCLFMVGTVHIVFHTMHRLGWAHPGPQPHDESQLRFIMFRLRDLISYFMTAALAVAISIGRHWHQLQEDRQQAEVRRVKDELNNLHDQIKPHFLLNTLNNIYALISLSPTQAQQAIQQLSRLLRHMLYESGTPQIPLVQEEGFLNSYVQLMRLRLPAHVQLTYHTELPPQCPISIAPSILISLFENAFKHGISPTQPSHIHIELKVTPQQHIYCSITNSNHPKSHTDRSGSGIGLQQVQRRLDLVYPGHYHWQKGPSADGTTYTSTLTIIP